MYHVGDGGSSIEKVKQPELVSAVREQEGREVGRHMVWVTIEAMCANVDPCHDLIGISAAAFDGASLLSDDAIGVALSGQVFCGGEVASGGSGQFRALKAGDEICLVVDCDARTLTIGVDDRVEQFAMPMAPPFFVSASFRDVGTKVSVRVKSTGSDVASACEVSRIVCTYICTVYILYLFSLYIHEHYQIIQCVLILSSTSI